jgi:hypothetical protein
VPVLKGEEGAGPGWETGAKWLARQSPETQEAILGRAGAAAYRAGAVRIEEYVGQRRSREWGSTRYARSLREILGKEEARKWREAAKPPSWVDWKPDREDARLVGRCGDDLLALVSWRAGVRDVFVTEATVAHYTARHADDFDLAHGESLLAQVISDPLCVYQGRKAATLLFVGDCDRTRYLIVPVKALRGELWLETMYVSNKTRIERRRGHPLDARKAD